MDVLKLLNNRYQLLSVIKRGGFGTIYRGYDTVLGKDIAIKEINQDLVQDSWYIDQFQNEARHVAKMNHQNIVHIFDLVETDDGQFYIVMEFIDGFDLTHILKESKLLGKNIPQHLAVHIVAEICKALDYAHNCRNSESNEPLNLVHQDVSPSNIMISKSGIVKLIDFGIAGVQRETMDDPDTITLQGKIQYMSPEHVASDQVLDKRSDIFCIGLVLYEMLEGKRFFQDEQTQRIVETLRDGKIKLKTSSRTPKPLQKILSKAIERSPEKRFQNANQLYIDLVTHLVMNHDSSTIDAELVHFMQDFTDTDLPVESFDKTLDIRESDLLLDINLDDPSDKSEDLNGSFKIPQRKTATAEHESVSAPNSFPKTESTPLRPSNGFAPEAAPAPAKPEAAERAADEIKTVIDVVRLSTRGHKKLMIRSSVTAGAFLLLFFLLDIAFQWTSVGASVYDFVFPPAIKIASVPEGAKVLLDDKEIAGTTPLSIDKIDPGVYELRLALPPYEDIVRSIHIPSKGQVEVKGEEIRSGNKPYTFKFKTMLVLESFPSDAEVFLNGIKFRESTPCSVSWEIGERCEIELRKTGFASLTGFALTKEMTEEIEDRRLWKFDVATEPTVRHQVTGMFGKHIEITSQPPKAEIYLDSGANPIGFTNQKNSFFFTATRHEIVLKKKGYNPRSLTLEINDQTGGQISATLTRPVFFSAYETISGERKKLSATLKKLSRDKKTVTSGRKLPIKLNLQPSKYSATFSMPGYRDKEIEISPEQTSVSVEMIPAEGQFTVVILENSSQRPVSNVEVRVTPMNENSTIRESVDVTDLEGTVSGTIPPGLYVFRTSKNGFQYQEKTLLVKAGDLNLIEFELTPQ